MRWPEGHCVCELEATKSGRCALCELEGCSSTVESWHAVEWDGETYPARRERRIAVSGEALATALLDLLGLVLDGKPSARDLGGHPYPTRTWLDGLMSWETWEPAAKPAREVA